jgi:hypothetical protein
MRFIVFVKSSPEAETGAMPGKNDLLEMQAFNQKLVDAGVMLAGEGLHPSKEATRLSFRKGKQTVTDGPFTEAKELVAGYWILEAKSKDEVINWMKQAPFQDGELEIRQLTDDEEFAYAPEVMANEKKLRAQIAAQHRS